MRIMLSSVACVLLLASVASATERGNCEDSFQAAFRSGAELHLDIRPGDVTISGTDQSFVRVDCNVSDSDRADEVKITFEDTGRSGRLRISGGPSSSVRISIQVPRQSNLAVEFKAGELSVAGVRGHKDISMGAGELTIDVGNPGDYSAAEASVKAGELNATAFGVHKGGLFRSFRQKNSSGKYRLRASLWAGDIRLR